MTRETINEYRKLNSCSNLRATKLRYSTTWSARVSSVGGTETPRIVRHLQVSWVISASGR